MRWFRGADSAQSKPEEGAKAAPRTSRRCIGLNELVRSLAITSEQKLSVLDLGPTSPTNIAFLTELGLRVSNEDILRDSQNPAYLVKQEDGSMQIDGTAFFAENLNYPPERFDAVLFWDVADYLPEPLVKPLVERLQVVLRPKGNLLAFFHTKDAGPESLYSRHHIIGQDTLELEPIQGFRLQRIFNNIREVLMVR
jgi:hypothetical protein